MYVADEQGLSLLRPNRRDILTPGQGTMGGAVQKESSLAAAQSQDS